MSALNNLTRNRARMLFRLVVSVAPQIALLPVHLRFAPEHNRYVMRIQIRKIRNTFRESAPECAGQKGLTRNQLRSKSTVIRTGLEPL